MPTCPRSFDAALAVMAGAARAAVRGATAAAIATSLAAAQGRPPKLSTAQPERPSVSTHAGTVTAGWFELESGIELDRGTQPQHNTLGVFAAKLGLAENLQLSLLANVLRPSDAAGGFGDMTMALKMRLLEDFPVLGDFAILPAIKFPTGSDARGTGTNTTDGTITLISSRNVFGLDMDSNVAYTYRGGSGIHAPRDAWLYAVSVAGDLPGGAGWTAEIFGVPGTSGAQGAPPTAALLAGPTFTLRKWLVLDFGGILPLMGQQPRALYAGLTYNVGRLWGEREKNVVR